MRPILVITTGGTIGSLPYENPSQPPRDMIKPPHGKDPVRDLLISTFSSYQTRCVSLDPRDSKDIDESYRAQLLTICEKGPENSILITHGTDALLKTAEFFFEVQRTNPVLSRKYLMLVGSMTPLANGDQSDGFQNLSCALNELSNPSPDHVSLSIVLSDYNSAMSWVPHIYQFSPGRYEKYFDQDGKYHRLKEIKTTQR